MKGVSCLGFVVTVAIMVIVLAGCARPGSLAAVSPYLTGAEQPKSPVDDPDLSVRDIALYIDDLALAGADCRRNLGSVRRILTTPEE